MGVTYMRVRLICEDIRYVRAICAAPLINISEVTPFMGHREAGNARKPGTGACVVSRKLQLAAFVAG